MPAPSATADREARRTREVSRRLATSVRHARIHATDREAQELCKLNALIDAGCITPDHALDMVAQLRRAQQQRAQQRDAEAA